MRLKKNYSTTIVFSFLFVMANSVFAKEPVSSFDDIINLFDKAAKWMYTIFFIVAVMYILFAAYTYLSAGDNSENVKKATKMIKNAIIAIIIALLSGGAALIINSFLTS